MSARISAGAATCNLHVRRPGILMTRCARLLTSLPILTLTAALVSGQLIARVTGTLVAAQRVDTALLTATVVRLGALVHLCKTQRYVRAPLRCASPPPRLSCRTRETLQNNNKSQPAKVTGSWERGGGKWSSAAAVFYRWRKCKGGNSWNTADKALQALDL